jgi:hemoglobin
MAVRVDITTPAKGTLYERLGGDAFINLLVCSFFDEIVENNVLKPFFKHISVAALKTHQVKLFRVIFGNPEDLPDSNDVLDFMLKTHTRLFREMGLNETHFDAVATCFVQGLESFQIDPDMVNECVAILMPLRVIFEYGAKVAEKEKYMDESERLQLPLASAQTIGTDLPVILPEYSKIEIPDWLPTALGKTSSESIVRAWTCELTDRFGDEGDKVIADTFLDQAYMDHHVYLVAFLELAFMPLDEVEPRHRQNVLDMVLYPRGRHNAPLSRMLFQHMIVQFVKTAQGKGMSQRQIEQAQLQLWTFMSHFSTVTVVVGGVNAAHVLSARRGGAAAQTASSLAEAPPQYQVEDAAAWEMVMTDAVPRTPPRVAKASVVAAATAHPQPYNTSDGAGTPKKKKSPKKKTSNNTNKNVTVNESLALLEKAVGGNADAAAPRVVTPTRTITKKVVSPLKAFLASHNVDRSQTPSRTRPKHPASPKAAPARREDDHTNGSGSASAHFRASNTTSPKAARTLVPREDFYDRSPKTKKSMIHHHPGNSSIINNELGKSPKSPNNKRSIATLTPVAIVVGRPEQVVSAPLWGEIFEI